MHGVAALRAPLAGARPGGAFADGGGILETAEANLGERTPCGLRVEAAGHLVRVVKLYEGQARRRL